MDAEIVKESSSHKIGFKDKHLKINFWNTLYLTHLVILKVINDYEIIYN